MLSLFVNPSNHAVVVEFHTLLPGRLLTLTLAAGPGLFTCSFMVMVQFVVNLSKHAIVVQFYTFLPGRMLTLT